MALSSFILSYLSLLLLFLSCFLSYPYSFYPVSYPSPTLSILFHILALLCLSCPSCYSAYPVSSLATLPYPVSFLATLPYPVSRFLHPSSVLFLPFSVSWHCMEDSPDFHQFTIIVCLLRLLKSTPKATMGSENRGKNVKKKKVCNGYNLPYSPKIP